MVDFDKIKNDAKYCVVVKCADCGEGLTKTHPMIGGDIRKRWVLIVASSPLNSPSCPNGCRASFSDCNANTDLVIEEVKQGETKSLKDFSQHTFKDSPYRKTLLTAIKRVSETRIERLRRFLRSIFSLSL